MKIQTTKKAIKENYSTILKIGYCDIQTLLGGQSAFAYSYGVYGWSCDYYNINGICISTGYSPIGEKVDNKLCKQFEEKAKKVNCTDWKTYQKRLNKLLDAFIKKALASIKEN